MAALEPDRPAAPERRAPSHAERARTVTAAGRTATLCTLAVDPAGHPYGSLVDFALLEGRPLLLLSELAEHTRNLRADPRCSLLVAEPGSDEPLARGRVTLLGRAGEATDPGELHQSRSAFLAEHPAAAQYAGFSDFHLWRVDVESVRYVGGFGRMSWIAAADWLAAEPDPLAAQARAILDHMNEDHAATMADFCRAFTAVGQPTAVAMTAVDRYGFEMLAETAGGAEAVRLAFSRPLTTPAEVRAEMVELARRAREELKRR